MAVRVTPKTNLGLPSKAKPHMLKRFHLGITSLYVMFVDNK